MISKEQIATAFQDLQDQICGALEVADGLGRFREDAWQHHSGGGGRTRIIENGHIIEKGGVNFSGVWGETSDALAKQMNLAQKAEYFATGVSIVQHPVSPMMPIIHMNIRYFELSTGACWFGGGIDLTPHYVVEADARWFHQQLKNTCDQHHADYYPKFKKWADDYFFIPHRNETRGVGGIFFDYLKPKGETNNTAAEALAQSKDELFDFVLAVGQTFAPIYTHLMRQNHALPYGEAEQNWQTLRRGRYVEFNLAWDRGTKFGLETNGRTESILMSLPPVARWVYNHQTAPQSREAHTLELLKKGIDWV
ncbi:MAG: oxygen-dependent coproporphyrinogen oxidase [Cytophagia bacterium]|nr:MAG: oxygen-dependent coproporphyrinogen oxidase [Runella sp.]TAG18926.1 MAG: oxygen-dependent coproporphyrinogen oxidase [Cytophagales bacterium]TAG39562.1 MAG: oxygen-dependent coproporphyrinogen oxidase [Cytophagia bacterium]TAG51140.1 MAG: oxygen-dependent coproporphyrinogen oxidase [Runella slithyformis]TAG81170.1 MAG: oxygen-dependent coproporphyrinogen oxidase [Cytophagales bacterium]